MLAVRCSNLSPTEHNALIIGQRNTMSVPSHASAKFGRQPSVSVLLAATSASGIISAVAQLKGTANTWVFALKTIDAAAHELKRVINQAGHDCLLICADFHDPAARMQAVAMAADFAGAITLIWNCTAPLE